MKEEARDVVQDVIRNLVIAPTSNVHLELATKMAERTLGIRGLDLTHSAMDPRTFTVGEFCPRFALGNGAVKTLQGKSVYITLFPSPYKNPETLVYRASMVAQAAKENLADKVVLLTTDLPHARQDRGPQEDEKALGELTTVRLHARTWANAGIDQVITTHAHSSRIAGFFALEYGLIHQERPDLLAEEARSLAPKDVIVPLHVDMNNPEVQELGKQVFKSISPHCLLADYILHQSSLVDSPYLEDGGARLVLKAVDKGNWATIDQIHEALYLPNAARMRCLKGRKAKNDPDKVEVQIKEIVGNLITLNDKLELLADDGSDTAGTLVKTVRWSQEGNLCRSTGKAYGVPEDRLVYFTHPWLGGESFDVIQRRLVKNLPSREYVTTNTRPFINDGQYYGFKEKSTVLRLAGLWADAILANEMGVDVTARYENFSSEQEQHEFVEPLYKRKRHSRHFLEDGRTRRRNVPFYLRE